MMETGGVAEPPEAVIKGETVPQENQEGELRRAEIELIMGELKTRPGYRDLTASEQREKALEYYRRLK